MPRYTPPTKDTLPAKDTLPKGANARAVATPGSPGWWSDHPGHEAIRRPMSHDLIASSALAIVDAEGLDALSMRRLASELHTGTAQLYRYVASKDEVLVYVLDQVMGEIGPTVVLQGDWRSQVETMAAALRATFVGHPNVAPLLATRIPIGPHALIGREVFLTVLLDHGFDHALAARAYLAVVHYVIGFLLVEINERGDHDGRWDARSYYQSLPSTEFPALTALADELTLPDSDTKFNFGLSLLLDGLASSRAQRVNPRVATVKRRKGS